MELKNGKFYENGIEVPIQLGNSEQIALLKKVERKIKDAETNGIFPDFGARIRSIDIVYNFNCVCGNYLCSRENCLAGGEDVESFDFDDYLDEIEGRKIKCSDCERIYRIKDGRAYLENN